MSGRFVSYSGHDDRVAQNYSKSNKFYSNNRGRGGGGDWSQPYRGSRRGRNRRGRGGSHYQEANPRSHLDNEADVDMGDGMQAHRGGRRFSPYGSRGGHATYTRGRGRGGRGYNKPGYNLQTVNYQGHTFPWFKVMIPFGKKTEKKTLLQLLHQSMSKPLLPVQFQYAGDTVVFFVQDKEAAIEIFDASRKIALPTGYKIITQVKGCEGPSVVMTKEYTSILQECMSKRYDAASKALSLSDLINDEDLREKGVYMPLTRIMVMKSVLTIINEHISELAQLDLSNNKISSLSILSDIAKNVPMLKRLSLANNKIAKESDLDYLKDLDLEELSLENNPICDRFKNGEAYVRAIRKRFPKVLILDGTTLPPPITFEIEEAGSLPPTQGNYLPNEDVQNLITRFTLEYFKLYDSPDVRPQLAAAYHDNAIMTMTVGRKTDDRQVGFSKYFDDTHNIIRDENYCSTRVKQGKNAVVTLLASLPGTVHDLTSFTVDVTCLQSTLLSFTLTGLFKELPSQKKPVIRYFSRLFVTVPQGAGIAIVNEQISLSNATTKQLQQYKEPPATPAASADIAATAAVSPGAAAAPVLDTSGAEFTIEQKQQMVISFSQQSTMNRKFSEDCLVQNQWNYTKAGEMFLDLKEKGQIPPEAFQQ